MVRTTLTIDDEVLKRIREKAARDGRTLQETVNDLLRQALTPPRSRPRASLDLRGWEAATRPGVDLLDRDKLFDLMDGG